MKTRALRPQGCPRGVAPHEWRAALMERIDRQAAILSTLIDALDAMDGDCDVEHNGDAEPWLGWCLNGALANHYDLEIDEGAVAK